MQSARIWIGYGSLAQGYGPLAHFEGPLSIWSRIIPDFECYHWKIVCKQLKLTNYKKWIIDYNTTYVVENV